MVGRHLCLSLYHLCGPSSFFLKYKVCSEQNNSIVPSCSLWFKLSVFLMVSSHLYSWLLLRWLIKSMVHTHTYLLIKWLFSRSLAFSSKHAFSLSLFFFFFYNMYRLRIFPNSTSGSFWLNNLFNLSLSSWWLRE